MGPLDFVFGIVFLGTVTGIVRMLIAAFMRRGGNSKALVAEPRDELRAALDRVRTLEAQLVGADRQNAQLQKQLEWHTKLLETQDRLVSHATT
jgi:hypothetical protein